MKVHKLAPHSPMCSRRIRLGQKHISICPQEKTPQDKLTLVFCSGVRAVPTAGVEYELFAFMKPYVVVPRDKVDPAAT